MPVMMEKSGPTGILSRGTRMKSINNGSNNGSQHPRHSEEESSDEERSHGTMSVVSIEWKKRDQHSLHDSMIRVGSDYQAVVPECHPDSSARFSEKDTKGMLVWSPNHSISDAKLDEYIAMAKEKHGYNIEQALGMLLWHKHDVDKSLADLANFTPFPDEWTVEDKVLFEQAFSFHGKSFQRIQQMLPDKLISTLVKYYYSWKKTRTRTSVMDRQARKLIHKKEREDSNDETEEVTVQIADDSDYEPDVKRERPGEPKPTNGKSISVKRESQSIQYRHHPPRSKRRPPKDMYLSQEEVAGVSANPNAATISLRQLDSQLISIKRQVQTIKQINSSLKQTLDGGIDKLRPPETTPKLNARWTSEEQLLAVQGIRKYGRNFQAIAEVIGNKTLAQVNTFFVSYRRRFNLEEILQEWEAEQEAQGNPAGILPGLDDGNGSNQSLASSEEEVEEEAEVLVTPVPAAPPALPAPTPAPTPVTAATLSQPPPLLRPALPAAPALHRQPPPLQQGRFLQSRPPLNQPPPPLIRPTLPLPPGAGQNPRPILPSVTSPHLPTLIGIQLESQSSSAH
ncbi:LOW QUALITY PROTEIN: REST corepressor 3-like [Scyliorhinus canicula]|uniref:LOW QUALITY PROTEIN: REST corepressor 3-like n=1 Tax=Scyliorhinus canicula TaxID=7830 RepID=UPI0018F61427|nr:LOW QUALITY PROTEIN: REST corepressor 3-like [Scyliorhinus canicula]